jgi:SMODS-associating 2TM, beta-strand rich effector domain
VVTYEYANEPAADAVGSLHAHRGTARLVLTPNGKVLEGDYYTGRDRKSHGVLRLEKNDVSSG